MKNTMRILSGLLTCLMVLSALPVFATTTETTSASTPEAFYVDFESFTVEPAYNVSTDSEWIAAGFNKGMAQGYPSISGNTSVGFAAKVVEDDYLGKAWQTPTQADGMYLGVGFDAPVTSGAVKLAFTVKANSGEAFPYILYATAMGTAYSKAESVKNNMAALTKDDDGAYIALFNESNSTDTKKFKRFDNDAYYDIELIVDVDNDVRYLYVDGVMMDECTHTTPIDQMQGFYFVHTSKSFATPKVDNILLTAYDVNSTTMNLVKTVNGDGKVKLVFDEVIDDTVTASDITFKEAGGTNNVTPSAIKVIGNTLEITFDASKATAGREYILTSDKLKSVNGAKGIEAIPFILKAVEEKNETIDGDDYDDINPDDYVTADPTTHRLSWNTETATSDFMIDRIYPMAYTANESSTNWGRAVPVYPVDWDEYRPDDGHGIVLNATGTTNFGLVHNQNTSDEYGVEVYEFEFASNDNLSGTRTKFNVYRNQYKMGLGNRYDGCGDLTFTNDGTWKKVKVVYDTVNDTVQLFLDANMDGTYEKKSGIKNVFATYPYQALDWYSKSGSYFDTAGDPDVIEEGDTTTTTWTVFDNFNSYVIYTPLTMEGARFVDKAGKDTISDSNVWAETTQIKVNFSEAVTEEAIENITVTKAETEDDIITDAALSEDGKTAILTVAGIVGSATYTINVPATVKSAANTPVTATTYTFTTGAGKFEINDFALTNADGTPIAAGTTDAENGNSLKVTADITNSNGTNKDVTIIYALYSGTTLVDVNFKDIKITPTSGDIDEDFTTKKDVTFDSWKAFIWDGFDTAVPQIEAFSGGAIN